MVPSLLTIYSTELHHFASKVGRYQLTVIEQSPKPVSAMMNYFISYQEFENLEYKITTFKLFLKITQHGKTAFYFR
jgi:hypothetical protein